MEKRLLRWSPIKSQSWSEINLIGHQLCMEKWDISLWRMASATPTRLMITFLVAEHHRPLASTKLYCLVNSLPGYMQGGAKNMEHVCFV